MDEKNIKEGLNLINNPVLAKGKRNFWVFLPLILFILMGLSFIPALSDPTINSSFFGLGLLFFLGYSIFYGLVGVISSIVLFIWPKQTLKIILNILSALIIIPIIYNNLSALWFEYIKIPEMETVRKEEVAQKLAEVNNKSFVPLAVHD